MKDKTLPSYSLSNFQTNTTTTKAQYQWILIKNDVANDTHLKQLILRITGGMRDLTYNERQNYFPDRMRAK